MLKTMADKRIEKGYQVVYKLKLYDYFTIVSKT